MASINKSPVVLLKFVVSVVGVIAAVEAVAMVGLVVGGDVVEAAVGVELMICIGSPSLETTSASRWPANGAPVATTSRPLTAARSAGALIPSAGVRS